MNSTPAASRDAPQPQGVGTWKHGTLLNYTVSNVPSSPARGQWERAGLPAAMFDGERVFNVRVQRGRCVVFGSGKEDGIAPDDRRSKHFVGPIEVER